MKIVFLEVAIALIGKNTSTKCLNCRVLNIVSYKEIYWCKKNVALCLFSWKIDPFSKLSTDLQVIVTHILLYDREKKCLERINNQCLILRRYW